MRLAGLRGPVLETLVMVMLRCSVCKSRPMGWLRSQLECGVTATGALDASCSHVLPVYKMHTKGPSDFKDKNILGARLVLSEEVYV